MSTKEVYRRKIPNHVSGFVALTLTLTLSYAASQKSCLAFGMKCLHCGNPIISKGLFTWMEGAPANRVTQLTELP